MSSYKKWIAGGLGWAMGGPLGAFLGFTLGSMLDNFSTAFERIALENQGQQQGYKKQFNTTRSGDFGMSLLVLSAAVMKADGKILKAELDYVKEFYKRQFGLDTAKEHIPMLKQILEKDIPVSDICHQIKMFMDPSSKLQLMHYLWGIAGADGHYDGNEINVLLHIADSLGISRQDSASIQAMFVKETDSAYKILEVDKSASDDEVKKAFREMAKKHHPDKVGHLGDDFKKAAEEKFRTVNEAWETIRKQRGIS